MGSDHGRSAVKLNVPAPYLLAGAGAVAVAVWLARRGVSGVAEDTGRAIVSAADGVATGVVTGIGEAVGIPKTNVSKGVQDVQRGDWWNASFDLPAVDFIREASNAAWNNVKSIF